MSLPTIQGIIKRRVLANYRVDPAVLRPLLPTPFRPKLHHGYAIAGICLFRLEKIRPRWVPGFMGVSCENAAHRVAVEWDEPDGVREGVYIPRRDTNSLMNHLAGGRLFPGAQAYADFNVKDEKGFIRFRMRSSDGRVLIELRGRDAEAMPPSSCFRSVEESSRFFECGCTGFSPGKTPGKLDAIRLETKNWRVRPLAVEILNSSFFGETSVFPKGSVQFDHALIMRDLKHEWHSEAGIEVRGMKPIEGEVARA